MIDKISDDKYRAPRRKLLGVLYQAHARLSEERRVACGPRCSVCCTDRLNLTSLEAELLAATLSQAGREDLLNKALEQETDPKAAPATTFNQLAELCIRQEEPPADQPPGQEAGACPLLEDGLCAVYEARPFACRAMVSKNRCQPGGQAIGEAWWFTLDTAFFQLIEHLDAGGVFGLMPRVLASLKSQATDGLLDCQFLPGLPAPAEHQEGLQKTLAPVFAELVDGRPLGLWFDHIRERGMPGK